MAETEHGLYYIEQIAPGAYKLYEQRIASMYLVCGKEKALLNDTAYGLNDLKELTGELTDLPVTVINTHGHIDHIVGNRWFNGSTVFMQPDDVTLYDECIIEYADIVNAPWVQEAYGDMFKDVDPSDARFPKTTDIREGDRIDLGGKTLEIVEVPGHTAGSILLIDRDEKICYAGDTIIEHVWLFLEESLSIDVYLKSLKKARKILTEAGIEKIYNGHFCHKPITTDKLDIIIEGVESIVAGKAKGEHFENFAGKGIEYTFGDFKVLCKE